jgi:tRNA (cytosine38-C5)-methyltransferase
LKTITRTSNSDNNNNNNNNNITRDSSSSSSNNKNNTTIPTRIVKPVPSVEEGISVFEFFSGIGGMRLSLPQQIKGVPVREITAFDINRVANQFYEYNFHSSSSSSSSSSLNHIERKRDQLKTAVVESLRPEEVDGKSDLWTMSPPCQPFTTTRGATRKDHLDNRSKGFYHLMNLLLSIK